jgi:hypothetical protein
LEGKAGRRSSGAVRRGCSADLPTSRRSRLWASSENVISLFCHELVWRSLEETEIFCDLLSRFELFEIKREGFFEKLCNKVG